MGNVNLFRGMALPYFFMFKNYLLELIFKFVYIIVITLINNLFFY